MEDILTGLNPQQEEAVKHFKGPLLILAGAGSGKTRVLTHRIAYLMEHYGIRPYHILALTFTNKAAGEMRERVDNIVGYGAEQIWVSTFHSTCVRMLRRYIEALGYKRSFTIYDADDQRTLMREIIKFLDLDPKKYKERPFLNVISSAKDKLITVEQYEEEAQGDRNRELTARAWREYEKRLKDANALDFDDLIVKTVQLLSEHPDVRDYYQNRFRYIMVDEYQDTNTAQFELIRLLASTKGEDGSTEHNLCVVGDDDQSIYKFRGANIMNILNFEEEYPDTKVIRLEENYRSTQNILDAANAVIKNNTLRKEKSLWTKKDAGDSLYYTRFENEYEEAESITDEIARAVSRSEADYKDFAILYRTNAQSRVFEEKLISHNIPYRIVGAVNFYQRKEIKDILAYLRTIDNGLDDISVKRIINVPRRGIGLTTIDRINNYALAHEVSFYEALTQSEYIDHIGRSASKLNAFTALIQELRARLDDPDYPIESLVNDVLDLSGYREMLEEEATDEAEGRLENLEELVSKAAAYDELETDEEDSASLSGFLEEVALVADIDTVEEGNNLVLLMTMHGAKGLEFPYVYMVGMEDGIFPGSMAIYGDDPLEAEKEMEEERRLCYVGITRAMKKLSLSCARSRFRNGEQQYNRPSRFIDEIPRHLFHAVNATFSSPSGLPAIGSGYPDRDGYDPAAEEYRSRGSYGYEGSGYQTGKDYGYGGSRYQTGKNYGSGGTGYQTGRDYGYEGSRYQTGKNYGSGRWNPSADAKKTAPSSHGGKKGLELLAGNPLIQKGLSTDYKKKSEAFSGQLDYAEGDRVHHARFGDGLVTALKPSGADYEVTVAFDNGNNRTMKASFAKMQKL